MSTTEPVAATQTAGHVHDDPAPGGPVPTSVSVVSALAQTTVSDAPISVGSKAMVAVPYANPFAEGAEELLVVDASLRLTQVSRDPQAQWQQRLVNADEPYSQVVVATHLDGTPWAFALTTDSRIHAFALQPDSTWKAGTVSMRDHGNWSQLQVQYLHDRPTTAWVFASDPTNKELRALSPQFPLGDGPDAAWWVEQTLPEPPSMSAAWACGWEIPEQGLRGPTPVLRLYVVDDERNLFCYGFVDRAWGPAVEIAPDVDAIIGIWSGVDDNLGVLFSEDGAIQLWSPTPGPSTEFPVTLQTDLALHDPVVWQDARGLLHIYGLNDGVLRGAHQTGWGKTVDGIVTPEFISVFVDNVGYIALTLPLRTGVDHFAVDAYPDAFPTQLVHRAGVLPQDAYSLLIQDTTTRWWSEESLTLTGDSRRLADRYLSTVSVTDKYGGPVPGAHVTLTAGSRTTVELGSGGTSWTLGPGARVQATTDELGQVTVRQAPTGLTVPSVHVEVPGVADGATIDAGASVRSFLAGACALPNHADGLTAQVLEDAKVHGAWLVPGWHVGGADDPLPTADEIVTWCREVLSPAPAADAAGWSLDLSRGPGRAGRDACLRRHATAGELAAHLEELRSEPSYGGVLPIPDVFIPDLWEAIAEGALPVCKVTINQDTQDAHIFVPWTSMGVLTQYEVEVSMADDAGAAHVVEATFQWIGAGVSGLLSWLSWGIDFGGVWKTATALHGCLDQLPQLLTDLTTQFLGQLPDDYFTAHAADLNTAWDATRQQLGASTASRLTDVTTVGQEHRTTVGPLADAHATLLSPHLSWLDDEIDRITPSPGRSEPTATSLTEPGGDPDGLDDLMRYFGTSPEGGQFSNALDASGAQFRTLFDLLDPATVGSVVVADVLAAFCDNGALLTLADDLGPKVVAATTTIADDLGTYLATPLEPPLSVLYQWFVDTAQVEDPLPATRGALLALQAAAPLTAFFESISGELPFPDGTFPVINPSVHGVEAPPLPLWLVSGASSVFFEFWAWRFDQFFNTQTSPTSNNNYNQSRTLGAGVFRLFLAGFNAVRLARTSFTSSELESAIWARTGIQLFVAIAEMYAGFRYGRSLNWWGQPHGWGTRFLSLMGLAQMWLSYRIYTLSPTEDIRVLNAWTGVFQSFSDATAFIRSWDSIFSPQLRRYVPMKATFDTMAHSFAAMYTLYGLFVEAYYPLTIGKVQDQVVKVDSSVSLRLSATGGWAPYTWKVDGLPSGLSVSQGGLISGTPKRKQTARVVCTVNDSYTPPVVASMFFYLTVE